MEKKIKIKIKSEKPNAKNIIRKPVGGQKKYLDLLTKISRLERSAIEWK